MDAECLKTILLDIAVHPVVMGNLIGRCGRKNVIGHTLVAARMGFMCVCMSHVSVNVCLFAITVYQRLQRHSVKNVNGTSVL